MKDISIDLNDLDINAIGSWPMPIRAGVIVIVCILVLVLGYFLDIKGQQQSLGIAEARELQLKQNFETKWKKAANLDAYKRQMKEMETSFGTMLRQLPSKTEIDDLLVDISQTGLASGINFKLFKPGKEVMKDFYAEFPIVMEMTGDYPRFGRFVSGIAALPRIVTLHDISIKRNSQAKDKGGKNTLTMRIIAKTYRYLDENEIANIRSRKNKNRRGRR